MTRRRQCRPSCNSLQSRSRHMEGTPRKCSLQQSETRKAHPALASNGVVLAESYVATGNHLTFTQTYATPDGFIFKQLFQLKAFRFTRPGPSSSFSLLDAVNVFGRHFQPVG